MFKFSAVLIICSIRVFPSLCSLPSIPFPLFPSLVPYQKQSVVFVTYTSPLLSKPVHSLPSSSLPAVPFPLSLLTIMFPPSFPIFDYAPFSFPYFWLCPDTLCPWCPYVTFARLLGMQFLCSKCLSVRTGQLLFVHKNYILKCHIIQCRRALLK